MTAKLVRRCSGLTPHRDLPANMYSMGALCALINMELPWPVEMFHLVSQKHSLQQEFMQATALAFGMTCRGVWQPLRLEKGFMLLSRKYEADYNGKLGSGRLGSSVEHAQQLDSTRIGSNRKSLFAHSLCPSLIDLQSV